MKLRAISSQRDYNAMIRCMDSLLDEVGDDERGQSNVSEVLSGQRPINARQARALAERFGVSAVVFI